MRNFIILAALSVAAVAHAEVSGYNYAASGVSNAGSSYGSISSGNGGAGGSFAGGFSSGGIQQQYGGGGGGGGNNVVSIGGAANLGAATAPAAAAAPETIEFSKEFFTYSAPESEFDDGKSAGDLAASMKRNLRVIFIRAPGGNSVADAALNLAKSASEQRTAIYVLTKQADLGDLAEKLSSLKSQSGASRPEVHFVKYRTPEDAANAQQTIQQQFNTLPGQSQSHDGGIAKVLNFASRPASGPDHGGAAIAPTANHQAQGPVQSGHAVPVQAQYQLQQQLQQQQQQQQHIPQQQASIGGGHAVVQSPSNAYLAPSGGGGGGGVAAAAPSATYLPIFKH